MGRRVAAVVVTYDRLEDLKDCVSALYDQSVPLERILVIDNAGPHDLEALLEADPRLEIVRLPINTGGAGGFSRGVREALTLSCDWIWLLDDDAIPCRGALEALLEAAEAMDSTPRPVLFSAVQEFGRLALRHRRFFDSWTGLEWPLRASAYRRPWAAIDTGSFVGCLLPREAAEAIPPPSADFFLAFDDTDYSLRLKAEGIPRVLVPGSLIDHRRTAGSRLREGPFSRKHFLNIRNHLAVKQRHGRRLGLGLLLGLVYGVLVFLRSDGLKTPRQGRWLLRALHEGATQCLGPPPLSIDLASEKTRPRGLLVLIRTQGRRLSLLLEAVDSALRQKDLASVWVLVHGDRAAFESVSQVLQSSAEDRLLCLSIPDRIGVRAYPLNVALERLYQSESPPLGLTFLDDDDWLEDAFSEVLLSRLQDSLADVIQAQSRSRTVDGVEALAYTPLPAPCLLIRNFMPINSYVLRVSSLRKTRAFFDEALEVLEDWGFLQRLLALGFEFEAVSGVHSGFRLLGDGNQPVKADQRLWDRAWQTLHEAQALLLPSLSARALLKTVRAFDFKGRPPLSPEEKGLVGETLSLIQALDPAAIGADEIASVLEGIR